MESVEARKAQLASVGHFLQPVSLPSEVRQQIVARDWLALDRAIDPQASPGGVIFEALRPYAEFSEIEFIISIRSSLVEPDEDGIWHDDGSRVLAFSLSLTEDPSAIEGGRLEIRKRFADGPETAVLPTPAFGTMIVFATGLEGYEHRINRVAAGERIIIAGWCT